jgi:sporulation protein YlmC with PRC-barrel domain
VDVIRDLLDKQVVDRHGREIGRVDSVIIDVGPGAPPRIVALELGPAVLFRRVHPVAGRWMAALEHAFGVGDGTPLRIQSADIIAIQDQVKVDLAAGETSAATLEHWLRTWLGSIPGSS